MVVQKESQETIRELNDKPLIYYTINHALKWGKADKIMISTDDEEIAKISKKVWSRSSFFLRPKELATDKAGKLESIKHAVKYYEDKNEKFDIIVDLDPTSPLRNIKDLDYALEYF